ncbi:MAG: Xaa-Pro dipeptidase [Gammaproteobacteria bacterium]|nr:Xaa-Pro dipeptidase [Gammaproteobacteria bacterium]
MTPKPTMLHQELQRLYPAHLADVRQRTEVALSQSGLEAVILHSGEAIGLFLDDQHYPFKAHPPFKWWLPLLDAPGSLVWFEPGKQPRLVFHVETDFWYQPAALPESWWPGEFEVVVVHSREQARSALPADLGRAAWIGDPLPELLGWGVGAINPPDLIRRLDFTRAFKTAYEIACLAEANRLGALGHRAAADCFSEGGSEYAIHQAFAAACGQREQELPYNAIVALNEAASVLHYQVLRREAPAQHRSLLLDAGASFAGYGSDITRTLAADTGEFADLVLAMDRLQLGLCELAKPGVDWRAIHGAAVERITALLCDAGVLRCSAAEALESGASRLFFPHGIGHLLGLQVHDVGGTMADEEGGVLPKPPRDPALRLTRRLEPGFVVTMEPGLYFIDALLGPARTGPHANRIDWRRVDALAPYGGIRIEDNLAVTVAGCDNLTRRAFAGTGN